MRFIKLSMQFAAFIVLSIFLACATTSTKFSFLWKDETYQGHPEKILVISTWQNPDSRKVFEDDFVMALKDRKVDAVASYTTMPYPVVSDKDAIAISDKAKEVGANTVLIDRRLGSSMRDESIFVNTQTDVYDMTSNKLVLSATAQTWVRSGIDESILIKSYIKNLVMTLSRQGLF
jgi:hypothetical protein